MKHHCLVFWLTSSFPEFLLNVLLQNTSPLKKVTWSFGSIWSNNLLLEFSVSKLFEGSSDFFQLSSCFPPTNFLSALTHLIWSRSFVVYLELFNSKKNLLRVFEMFNKNQISTRQDCTYYVIWVKRKEKLSMSVMTFQPTFDWRIWWWSNEDKK